MSFEDLLEEYDKDMAVFDSLSLEKIIISLPKRISKYQRAFWTLVNELNNAESRLDEIYSDSLIEYKQNLGKHANIIFSATELQKILKTDEFYSKQAMRVVRLKNNINCLDKMIKDVRDLSYKVNNLIDLKKIINLNN